MSHHTLQVLEIEIILSFTSSAVVNIEVITARDPKKRRHDNSDSCCEESALEYALTKLSPVCEIFITPLLH